MNFKKIIIVLGIVYMINFYFNNNQISIKEIDKTIFDINNAPSEREKIIIKNIKEDLIKDIESTNNLSEINKKEIALNIRNIKFICVDTQTMQSIDKDLIACYFKYSNKKDQLIKVIIINNNLLDSSSSSLVIIHELRHLVDDVLINDEFHNTNYSDYINIVDILDKDIVLQNESGKKKLNQKIEFFSEKLSENIVKTDLENNKDINFKKQVKLNFKNAISEMFTDKETNKYLTSSAEVYVRFHSLKRYMIENKFIKDMNDTITQDKIIQVLNSEKFINDSTKYNLDFIELLFFLNIDFTGQRQINFTKVNYIVTNYKDLAYKLYI